jgi:4,5-DOPA dioxygenase extradiol
MGKTADMQQPHRTPALFFGHGSPMNAITDTRYSRAWHAIGASLASPRAILAISAHWDRRGLPVTAMPRPRTIHDFGGFPQELYQVEYSAPGSPELAERVAALLAPRIVTMDQVWGLDHGTWSVLIHAFPAADVPVVQLSIDTSHSAEYHYDLGRALMPLRQEGVLIVGSGNVVHNLRTALWKPQAQPYDWATRFNDSVRKHLAAGEHPALVHFELLNDARTAIPTPEHFLPFVVTLGLQDAEDSAEVAVDGIELGSIGMLAAVIGGDSPI